MENGTELREVSTREVHRYVPISSDRYSSRIFLFWYQSVIQPTSIFLPFYLFSIEVGEWNKFNDDIGLSKLPDDAKQEECIGAERKSSKFRESIFKSYLRSQRDFVRSC